MLWNDWEIDSQYSYGFLVPILCMALFHMRWKDRPAQAPEEETESVAMVAGFGFALALLPLFLRPIPNGASSVFLGLFLQSASLLRF